MRLKTWLLGVGMVALAARAGDVRTVEYRGIYADDPCGREGSTTRSAASALRWRSTSLRATTSGTLRAIPT